MKRPRTHTRYQSMIPLSGPLLSIKEIPCPVCGKMLSVGQLAANNHMRVHWKAGEISEAEKVAFVIGMRVKT